MTFKKGKELKDTQERLDKLYQQWYENEEYYKSIGVGIAKYIRLDGKVEKC